VLKVELNFLHNYCFKKQNLLDKSETSQIFNNTQERFGTSHFTFLLGKRNIQEPGLCVILAKKNIKKAPKRNLCRRLLKEDFRLHKDFFCSKGLVVLGKKPAASASKEELWESIKKFHLFLQN
jgi:ribonuclease P protein component